jgi:hypothetical protein
LPIGRRSELRMGLARSRMVGPPLAMPARRPERLSPAIMDLRPQQSWRTPSVTSAQIKIRELLRQV